MAYYDQTDELELQILNRLRDLLENDTLVRAENRYPAPKKVHSLQTENIDREDNVRVSVVFAQGDNMPAASTTQFVMPTLALVVQKFCSTVKKGTDEEEEALKVLANVTGAFMRAIVGRYQSDPTPLLEGQTERLWDSMTFPGATRYDSDAKGFYFSLTYLSLQSYQRNK